MNLISSIFISPLKALVIMLSLSFLTIEISAASVDLLFQSDEIIKLKLSSDFTSIQETRTGTPEYHQGELTYRDPGRKTVNMPVLVRARGNFRLKPSNCDFPPLLIDFSEEGTENTIFNNQDRLKLVTPCQSDEDVLDEYTVYKMYNQVTDQSIRVRLVKIEYFDTGQDKKLFEKYSFFIEDKDHAAVRNNSVVRDTFLTPSDLNRENLKKLSVFQYIIGNRDWIVSLQQNIIIMQDKDNSDSFCAVPYDFDFSGFVNAEYTQSKILPRDPVSERRAFKGLCYTDDELKEVFEFYTRLRPVFESIIKDQKAMTRFNRDQILTYLDDSYKIIENSDLFKKEFLSACETEEDNNLSDQIR